MSPCINAIILEWVMMIAPLLCTCICSCTCSTIQYITVHVALYSIQYKRSSYFIFLSFSNVLFSSSWLSRLSWFFLFPSLVFPSLSIHALQPLQKITFKAGSMDVFHGSYKLCQVAVYSRPGHLLPSWNTSWSTSALQKGIVCSARAAKSVLSYRSRPSPWASQRIG